jgi:hypothetical protein
MRRALALVLVAACHKSPPPGSDADALWDLAPDGTELGVVATPRALALAGRALDTVRALAATPDFARYKLQVDAVVTGLLGKPDATLADAGLATDRGFAMFVTKDGVVGALPVADRDKFVALKNGKRGSGSDDVNGAMCKPVKQLYVCATNEAMFARLGKQSLRGRATLAGARGDVEVFAPALDIFGGNGDLALTAQLQPGQVELRGRWAGTPGGGLAPFTGLLAPKLDALGASGFAAVNIAPFLKELPAVPIAGGVTFDQLGKALKGPIIATCPAGTTDLQLHIPLADPAPVQALIDHCDELPLDPRPTTKDGTCRLALPALSQLDVDVWVEGSELRVGTHRGQVPPGKPHAVTAFGKQLASGDWTAVFWGRGTMLETSAITPMSGDVPDAAATSVHMMALVSEVGAGVKLDPTGISVHALARTIWANPQGLGDKLAAIPGVDILHGGSAAKALATAGTPFAADFATGQGGLMIPAALLGFSAALIAPALSALTPPGHENVDETELVVKQYAYEAYPQWAAAHPAQECPGDIAELAEYSSYQVLDPWGHKLVAQCGAALPAGAKGIAIHSFGPDGVDGTADDILSW